MTDDAGDSPDAWLAVPERDGPLQWALRQHQTEAAIDVVAQHRLRHGLGGRGRRNDQGTVSVRSGMSGGTTSGASNSGIVSAPPPGWPGRH